MELRTYDIDLNSYKKIDSGKLALEGTNPAGDKVSFTNYYMELNGEPFIGISGEFHFSRYTYEFWEKELIKMKMAGVNIISTYIFWIHHEEEKGIFNWSNNNNIRYFVELCAKHDLYIILRIGAFCHGECRNGGLPDWLYGKPFEVRSNDDEYLFYVGRLYDEIGRQVYGQMYHQGGPVIGIQLENEHMHASAPWEVMAKQGDEYLSGGKEGAEHINALKKLAIKAGLKAPLYTCTAWGGASFVEGETLPLYGGYAFCPWNVNENNPEHAPTIEYLFQNFHDNESKCLGFEPPYPPEDYPYACCEVGGGMICWYKHRFVVPPESVEATTIIKIAGGCNFIGYYLFHDGSNPIGKHSYMNECVTPKIAYSYQAPLGEFGQIRDSYRFIKPIFYFLKEYEQDLCNMGTVLPSNAADIEPNDIESIRYAARTKDGSGFLFLNNYQDHKDMIDHYDIQFQLNLPDETINIPKKKGLTLKKDVSAILPFNFKMDDIWLKYSTAQFITSINDNNVRTYFFYVPEGMGGEYCFNSCEIEEIDAVRGTVERESKHIIVAVEPGKECIITLKGQQCKNIRICTLTRYQALQLWKTNLWGKERIILSNADVIVQNENMELNITGEPEIELSIYPAAGVELSTQYGKLSAEIRGIFKEYSFTIPEKEFVPVVEKKGSSKAVIKVPYMDFDEIEEIFVNIHYKGDGGNAFIDDKLISDNFCNGTPWEIGLRRFYPEILEKGIYINITPIREGKVVISDSSMAIKHEFIGNETAEIYDVEFTIKYRTNISINRI